MELAFLALVLFASPIFCDEDPIVEISNGKIRGRDFGHYLSFESIPYAEPPIGENRFESPKPFTSSWSDIRDATVPPVKCMQWDQFPLENEDVLNGEENCLTVNIYTPSIDGSKKYPVLVMIHGGAFMFGTANQNGHEYLMEKQNIVLVKVNYRLGPLGFLSTGDEVIPGNNGLKDQLMALKWVKANIAAFNGDPENLSVIGFSAGAGSVHLHMMNKDFEKIAKRGIAMSGSAVHNWAITKRPQRKAMELAKHLDCPTESSLALKSCLKGKNPADVVRAVGKLQNIGYNPALVFGPVIEPKTVEDAFITENPADIIKSGKSAEIPFLASFSKDEGGYNAAELMQKDSNGKELIEILNDRWNELAPGNLFYENEIDEDQLDAYSNSLKEKYLGDKNFSAENYPLIQKMYTDLMFSNGVKKAWQLHKQYSSAPVYGYVFDSPQPFGFAHMLSKRNDISFGTVHGDDYYLIFKHTLPIPSSKLRSELSQKFVKMISDFCANEPLQFGDCKFRENNANTNGLYVMQIRSDSCEQVEVENLP